MYEQPQECTRAHEPTNNRLASSRPPLLIGSSLASASSCGRRPRNSFRSFLPVRGRDRVSRQRKGGRAGGRAGSGEEILACRGQGHGTEIAPVLRGRILAQNMDIEGQQPVDDLPCVLTQRPDQLILTPTRRVWREAHKHVDACLVLPEQADSRGHSLRLLKQCLQGI